MKRNKIFLNLKIDKNLVVEGKLCELKFEAEANITIEFQWALKFRMEKVCGFAI